ncbi:MAG: glycosyltransferase family 4 protein [Gemmatimonadetes bacterium]|nr:glycosyltransferase family 4 protein [Gemmatimonadota bacterium]
MSSTARPIRVFFPCTGLGRVARGFETFTRDCADALRGRDDVALTVFGGGQELTEGERHIASLSRRGAAAGLLGKLLHRDPYFVEQASFAAAFLPALIAGDPDVVYFADLNVGNACWHWRRISGQRFRLLFYNGGATTKPFTRCDLVQQVSPEHYDAALARGESAERQVLLPHGLQVSAQFTPVTNDERRATRAALGVPLEGPLVLSVGMLDQQVKRMDLVIRETAALTSVRPHLLLLGEETPETPTVRALAERELGAGRYTMRTVHRTLAMAAYRAADTFVLASPREGFGLAYLEALMSGVPCVVQDTPTTAYVYGAFGHRADLSVPGVLAGHLEPLLATPPELAVSVAQHAWVRDRFGWANLAPRYAAMLHACAEGRRPVVLPTD